MRKPAAPPTAAPAVDPATPAGTPIPPAPKDFAGAAVQSDQYEILAAHTALAQSQDARVRSFAQGMLADHTRLAADLRQAAAAAGLPPPPPGISPEQAMMLSSLQSLRGAAFDRAYAQQQVLAHAQAMAVIGSFAGAGADPTLRKAAQAALPTIQGHQKMAQDLAAALGAA